MSESFASTMATRRYVTCVILGYILFVLQPNSQTLASPLSIGNLGVSEAVGKAINGTKNFFGFGHVSSTADPPTTTKKPFYVVLIPKTFSKKDKYDIVNGTTTPVLTTPKSTKSNRFIEGAKTIWAKAKRIGQNIWSKPTTSPPPTNVWLVPVDWSKLTATGPPCTKGHNGQGCLSSSPSSQLSAFSWWTLSLSLAGALLMGVAAWVVFRRRWPGSFTNPADSIKVAPPKLPWPWYPSGPDCASPRGPAPLPPPALKATGGPPSWPAPPVPGSARANSLYQTTPAAAGHVYATPAPPPYSAWASNANEHVHVYETPPCFPSYDLADQEIDTTALKKAAIDAKQVKC